LARLIPDVFAPPARIAALGASGGDEPLINRATQLADRLEQIESGLAFIATCDS
jgi:hypothetical protein